MYEAYIFDFDGVILDTEKYHYLAWSNALKQFNVAFLKEEYEPLKSTGRNNIISYIVNNKKIFFSEKEISKLIELKDEYFSEYIKSLNDDDLIPGVVNFLDELVKKGKKLAVVSSSITASVLLEKFHLKKYFHTIIDGNDGFKKKPDPESFLKAVAILDVKPNKAIIFEDSLVGLQASQRANINAIYVGREQHSFEVRVIENFIDFMI